MARSGSTRPTFAARGTNTERQRVLSPPSPTAGCGRGLPRCAHTPTAMRFASGAARDETRPMVGMAEGLLGGVRVVVVGGAKRVEVLLARPLKHALPQRREF